MCISQGSSTVCLAEASVPVERIDYILSNDHSIYQSLLSSPSPFLSRLHQKDMEGYSIEGY